MMEHHYRDAIPAGTGEGAVAPRTRADYKAALTLFYENHGPEKVAKVDTFLDKWERTPGGWGAMAQQLGAKYGVDFEGFFGATLADARTATRAKTKGSTALSTSTLLALDADLGKVRRRWDCSKRGGVGHA